MGNYGFILPRKVIPKTLFFLIATLFYYSVAAQPGTKKDSVYIRKTDTVKQIDGVDVLKDIFRINISSKPDTAKIPPWKMLLSFAPAVGYTLEAEAQVSLAVNLSFYTGDQSNTNLSVINTGGQYSVLHQLMVPVISNIWSNNNKFDFLGDWRYYKYPSYTYGLGSNTSESNADYVNYSYIKVYQEALRHFNSNYYLGFGYNLDYHYNIIDNSPVTNYSQYNGTATQTTSSGLVFHFMYDSRTNINNPQDAFYGSILYRDNSTLLGSSQNWQYVQLEARKYFKLSAHKVLAFWSWNEFTFGGKAPYFDLPSNGWDTYSNTGRGYIQGRFRGSDMVYGEAELRFGITRNGLLGGVIFANATSVTNWPQVKFNEIFPGEGVGLRIKFNKYSDVNVCVDYAFGIEGSRGFFFNLGEVF